MDVSVCIRDIEEDVLRLLRFMDVRNVDLRPHFIPHSWKELNESNIHDSLKVEEIKKKLAEIVKVLRKNGFHVNSTDGPAIQRFFMDDSLPLDDKIENVAEYYKDFIDILSELEIPIMLAMISLRGFGPEDLPGRYGKIQPRGYLMGAFSFHKFEEKTAGVDKIKGGIKTFEDLLAIHVKLLKRIAPYAEKRNVKIAIHPDDPPIEHESIPPGYTSLNKFRKLLDAVNSQNVGLVFCVGTFAEAGEDIYGALELLMKERKVFHVHLRNIKYNLPKHKCYDEVMIDEGDINLIRILKILKDNDYEGTINPDHVPIYHYNNNDELRSPTCWNLNDKRCREGYLYTIGYIKGIIAALNDS